MKKTLLILSCALVLPACAGTPLILGVGATAGGAYALQDACNDAQRDNSVGDCIDYHLETGEEPTHFNG